MDWLSMLPREAQDGVKWVVGPSIVPWVGAVAAILAAFATAPVSWLKHFWGMFPRAILVVAVWFGVVWLINYGLTNYVGGGPRGSGGSPGAGDGVIPNGAANAPPLRSDGIPGLGSPSLANAVDVRFVNVGGRAADLACNVEGTVGMAPLSLPVRAASRPDFDRHFTAAVLAFARSPGVGVVVRIHRAPDPGDGAVASMKALVQKALPGAAVSIESE